MKSQIVKILIAALLFVAATFVIFSCKRNDKVYDKYGNEIVSKNVSDTLNKEPQISEGTSEVIDARNIKPSGPMPSYCKSSSYKILRRSESEYLIMYRDGDFISDDIFPTIEAAQKEINEYAKLSYQRWIGSNGTDF
jgi:hypothetical protein